MEFAVRGLLSRHEALAVRPLNARILKHPHRDPGCRVRGAELLRNYVGKYHHALLMFDREGSGCEARSREELEAEQETALRRFGWGDNAAAVVIDPELEIWVWSDSPHVDRALGWSDRTHPVREWLRDRGFFREGQAKPSRPKEAMQAALREARRPPSSALFQELAQQVSFQRCRDAAFLKLKRVLQQWFSEG
jgi:hypothetical protein